MKNRTALDEKVSVFPESRELRILRGILTLFTCHSIFTAETDRNLMAAVTDLKQGEGGGACAVSVPW